jgi:hypothetical protein
VLGRRTGRRARVVELPSRGDPFNGHATYVPPRLAAATRRDQGSGRSGLATLGASGSIGPPAIAWAVGALDGRFQQLAQLHRQLLARRTHRVGGLGERSQPRDDGGRRVAQAASVRTRLEKSSDMRAVLPGRSPPATG